jgi:anaerobic magnesium-protoporphyrin IX monomethyl ester cyclase
MVNTLLVAPPYSPFTPVESAVPPLGLARLATIARELGETAVVDMGAYESAGLDGWEALTDAVARFEPEVIGIGPVVTANRMKALRIASMMRPTFPEAVIVVGGPDVTFTYEKLLTEEPNIDIVFIGESELSFADFLTCMSNGVRDWSGIGGIAFRQEDRVQWSPSRFLTRDEFDQLPHPSWDLFPLSLYKEVATRAGATPYLPIETSRGCALGCIFCACSALFERRFRNRSAQSVLQEMRSVRASYGFTRFALNDDNPSINVQHVLSLASVLDEREHGGFELTLSATVDCRIFHRPDDLELLRRSGFCEVFMGCETTSPAAIAATRKTKRPHEWEGQIAHAIRASRDAGLASRTSWILGLPQETPASFLHTIEFLEEVRPDTALLSLLQPYPGTLMAEYANDPENEYGLKFVSDNPSAMIASKFEPVVETRYLKRETIIDLAFKFLARLAPSLQANVSGSPYYLFELWRTDKSSVGSA